MKPPDMHRLALPVLLLMIAGSALAHPGHTAHEAHLHEHELLGLWLLVGLSAVAAAWIWFSGGRDR